MQKCQLCKEDLSGDVYPVAAASWAVELRTTNTVGKSLGQAKCRVCLSCGHVEFFVEDLPDFRGRLEKANRNK